MIQSTLRLIVRCVISVVVPGIMLIVSGMLVGPSAALAQARTGFVISSDAQGHATIIVLDMSGSMGQNDPHKLRCSAASAYIDLSGVNDYIGLVGLDNNNGLRTGSHNFQTAQVWAQPTSTATIQNRQGLKNTLTSQSNNCNPDSNTPTYDSLNQAYTMLDSVTKQHTVTGSVILLTDGVPCPDTDTQISAIKADLVSKFQARGWPIDSIGLGQDTAGTGTCSGTFHSFLKDVSNATGGTPYDDSQGPISGVSPLNIGPFFVQIFAHYSHRTVGGYTTPISLDGGTTQRNFTVIDGTTNLDIIVVKDTPSTTISMADSNRQPVSPLSSSDYNVVYSIDQPQSGQWIVSASGSGQFLLYSLEDTNVGLATPSINLPNLTTKGTTGNEALPLGQPLVITTSLTENGQPITDNTYSVYGTIAYGKSAGANCASFGSSCWGFKLTDNATPGTYVGNVNVPVNAPSGTYIVTVSASTISLTNIAATNTISERLEVFPIPSFLSPQTKQPTDTPINATVIQWQWPLPWLYSLPALDHLSGWALQGHPADASTNLPGELQWQGQPYPNATIKANACAGQFANAVEVIQNGQGTFCPDNAHTPAIPVTITQDAQGNFTAQFQPHATGLYTVFFKTSGAYKDSHGDFGPTKRSIQTVIEPQSLNQLLYAVGVTGFLLLMLLLLFGILRFLVWTPRPFGEWIYNPGGDSPSGRRFDRAHRGPIQWFFKRNQLTSRQAGMPSGLSFRFLHGKSIEVKPDNSSRAIDWQLSDGRKLRQGYQRVGTLVFRVGNELSEEEGSARYVIDAGSRGKSQRGNSYTGHDRSSRANDAKRQRANQNRSSRSSSARASSRHNKQASRRDYYYNETDE